MDPFPPHIMNDSTWQPPQLQQSSAYTLPNQMPPQPLQKNTSYLHFNDGHYQDAMSKVNSIFINNSIAGGPQTGLDTSKFGIASRGIIPNTAPSISQPISATLSTSAASIPGSDSGETRANGVGTTSSSNFAAALGFSEESNTGSDSANQAPYSSQERYADDSAGGSNSDVFDMPASPEPNGDSANKKRNRLRPEQTRRLMEVFERTPKPDSEMRKILGKQLEMTPRTVQIWFQNRRAKLKRESNTVNLMRSSVYAASGIFDGRNAHRLTYNRAYINRRPTGRVASDGYAHLRNIPEFDQYHPHDAVHGLPLQSPSQISIPLNLRIPPSFPTLNSAPSSAHPSSDSLMFGNSAMGVPVGQDARGDILASTAMGGHSHITNPFAGTGASNDAMQAVFPNSTSFLSTTQAYPGAIPDLSSSSAMQSFGIGAPQTSMQAQDEYYSSRPAAPSHIRTRSFTADSHTLANLGQVPPTRECNNSLAPLDTSMAPSPTGISQHGLMSHSNNVSSIFGSPDGVPTAEALLESRRRHLNDLIIINQTQAVRGIRTSDVPQSTHISVPSSAVEPDSSNKPLLFSNLSSVDTQIIDTIAASASGSVASGQPVAGFIAGIGGNNIDLGMPSTQALDYRNQQAARPSSDDTSEAIITSMPAPPQLLAGCTADSDMSALFEIGKGTLGDDHSSTAKEPHAKAFGAADLPNGLEHSLANGDSNYQFLNSLLLDCNTLDLLGGPNGSGQEQPGVSGASERSPHLAVGSSVLDVALSQRSLADALLVNRQFAGSSSREGSIAPDIAFSRELSANCPQQSSRSSSLSDSSISVSNATVDVESFLLASTSNTTSPSYSAQNMAEAVAFLHTSASEASPLQPKRSPSNQVSVARSGVPGQRDLMIEQLSYSTMPL